MPHILGVKVDNINRAQAITKVEQMLRDGGQHIITTPNPEFIVGAQKDPQFREILNQSSLALPDGIGLIFAARVLKIPLPERIAGSDFIFDIARIAAERGHTMYLLGGRGEVAQRAAKKLKLKFDDLIIAGAESGIELALKDSPSQQRTVLERISNTRSDILLVAFGHPRQEKWIAANLPKLPSVKIAMGVGGTFDFIAGNIRRAPRAIRLLGLEWLWRLARQPRRLPRIFRAVVVFPWLVLLEKLSRR